MRERPGKTRREAVVDRPGRLGDGARAVGSAAGEHGDGDAVAVGHGDEADVVGQAVSVPVLCSTGVPVGSSAGCGSCRSGSGHQAQQIIAALRLDQLRLVDAPEQIDHRHAACWNRDGPTGCACRSAVGRSCGRRAAGDAILLQPVMQRLGPPRSLSRISVARLSLWISIRSIRLRADWPSIVSSSERRPWSTCAK